MTVRFVPIFAASLLLTGSAWAQNGAPAPAEAPTAPVSSAAAPRVEPSAADTSKDYKIGPGDQLDIWVWEQDDLTRTVPVRPDGKISYPYVNDVMAAGRTTTELTEILTKGLTGPIKTPVVAVMVRDVRSAKASVAGEVKMPNTYDLRDGNTLLELIAKAQGLTEFADKGNIILIRAKNGERIKVNWNRVVSGKEPNHVIEAGDIVVVND